MGGLYHDRYNIESTRLRGWNYASSGFYFVTICTHGRVEYLGDVMLDNEREYTVALSGIGQIVRDELLKTPDIRPYVRLDEWVIMPNHVHAIIVINNCRDALHASHKTHQAYEDLCVERDARGASLQGNGEYKNTFGPQRNNLASIIRGFKGAVTRQCRESRLDFHWQPRFYDHIIRAESLLQKIREYIKKNPQMWYRDRNNAEGLLM